MLNPRINIVSGEEHRVLFTADTHFGHGAQALRRGFTRGDKIPDTKRHDENLVETWRSAMMTDSVIFHLGDFAFAQGTRIAKLVEALTPPKGEFHLIEGNHDRFPKWCYDLFDSVTTLREIKVAGQGVVLCHYPLRTWKNAHFGAIHFHGHSHGNAEPWGGSFDVGVDSTFRPLISWYEAKALAEGKEYQKVDHHGG